MTKLINICDNLNEFDRYKMPDIEVRYKDNGKYQLSFITNLSKISSALHIESKFIIKFYSQNLNTQSKYNDKLDELQLKGFFDKDKLLRILRLFINKYVLCPECDLPEIIYKIYSNKIKIKCEACGLHKNIDINEDKIYKYILQCYKPKNKKKRDNKIDVELENMKKEFFKTHGYI